MKKLIVIVCSVLTVLFVIFLASLLSTQKKVQQYLEMPAYVGAVPEHVRSEIIAIVPLGTSQQGVDDFLSSRGIGKDGDSSCKSQTTERVMVCSVGMHRHAWEPIREIYNFYFTFDSKRRLQGVTVRSRITGFSSARQ